MGTEQKSNQDRILVNGHLLSEGEVHLIEQSKCMCFVADGVGGCNAGEYASSFVLEQLNLQKDQLLTDTEQLLQSINHHLISSTINDEKLKGCCTTLSGILVIQTTFKMIHAGDSEIWLLRDDMFFKLTIDHVLDDMIKNSPITSYFGGTSVYLKPDTQSAIQEILPNDIFLICSDGLFKSLNYKMVKSILKSGKDLEIKAKKIRENCLLEGVEDNVSVILIQLTHL